ncbi:hypothetical protein [Salinicoccus albus]|uniref:hypothetical protein n=1 Tax=Salinicoccus albus TaxID=418756 RepID=UPI000371039F|nr:hypothetical protein [Salinicoccus albus]
MKQYKFKVSLKDDLASILMINEQGEKVGDIQRDVMRKCDDQFTYTYTPVKADKVTMGMKTRKLRDLNIAKYILVTSEGTTIFKERAGSNLLRFRVDGKISDNFISIEENKDGGMELILDNVSIITVTDGPGNEKTVIEMVDDIDEYSIVFAVSALMFFMYKLYKRESWYIEEMLT